MRPNGTRSVAAPAFSHPSPLRQYVGDFWSLSDRNVSPSD